MSLHENLNFALQEQIVLSNSLGRFSFSAIDCVGVGDYPFATPPLQVNEARQSW